MKYIVAIPDGASDQLRAYLQGDTPLRAADTPTMDELANCGEVGWAKTVPDSLSPGSDVACLSIFGYDTLQTYTGRAPLEAANMGIDLGDRVAFRCNLVTIENGVMKEFTAGHITTEEAAQLVQSLNERLGRDSLRFHTGVQYRHILTAPGDWNAAQCTPPHDILDQKVESHLPQGAAREKILDLMERSKAVFSGHPINQKRAANGKPQATQIWLWGQGTKPNLTTYADRFGVSGAVVSAVDLIQGIGRLGGLQVIKVSGATGLMDTNYEGKAEAALQALEQHPFVVVHVESTDEMGHAGDAARKTQAIHDFDCRMLRLIVEGLRARGDEFRLLLLPDHPTPIAMRTHVNEPVPFLLYDSRYPQRRSGEGYSELGIRNRTRNVFLGRRLIEVLFQKADIAEAIVGQLD